MVKVEALARLGKLLKNMPKAEGTRGQLIGRGIIGGSRTVPPISTLEQIGLTRKTSAVAQQLAALPKDTREAIARREGKNNGEQTFQLNRERNT